MNCLGLLMGIGAKYKAIGINILISTITITLFLLLAWKTWFPSPFAEISDFSKIAQLMFLSNFCLGPLLVFIVYKENKRHLKLDLTILAFVQLSAFVFGVYSLYLKHPVYVVFTVDRFTLVNARNATPDKVQYSQLSPSLFSPPKLIFAKRPESIEKRNELLFSVLFEGKPDLDRRAEYYEPFVNHFDSVFERSISTKVLFPDHESRKKLITFLKKQGGSEEDYAYFPLQGNRGKDVILVLDRKQGEPVGSIDTDPWQVASKN